MSQGLLTDDLLERLLGYEGMIFDCDGTLTDSMPLHFRAWQRTMREHGIEFEEDHFYRLGGMPTHRIIELLSDQNGVQVDPRVAGPQKEAAFEDLIDELTGKADVIAAVTALHGRMPLAVASGGFFPAISGQLRRLEIVSMFDAIVTAEDTERHKPEPDVFLEAARRLGVPPTRCLVWEDSPLGFQAASAAGMDCVDVRIQPWVWLT
jgi:beta-phosphoglucomutase-like phosphatase (HAD superfamily)